MKKNILAIGMAAIGVLGAVTLAGCNGGEEGAGAAYITTAIARTAGSGTRGAFDELVVNSEGEALEDHIGEGDWILTAGTTGQVVTQVGDNSAFLGYISMGSVDANKDKIKAVKVNGVDATVAEVLAGNYELSRPFNLIYGRRCGGRDHRHRMDRVRQTCGKPRRRIYGVYGRKGDRHAARLYFFAAHDQTSQRGV